MTSGTTVLFRGESTEIKINPVSWGTHERRCGRGQALVEFAFVLPVLLIIVFGMIELGRAFVFGVAVQDAARNAARLAANARINPGITDAVILQRLVDASSPAMVGCAVPASTTSTPVTLTCGGGTWTVTMAVTPNGWPASSSSSSFSALPTSGVAQLNGGTVEVKVVGSVSLLNGLSTGTMGLRLYSVTVQGDAVMAVL